MYVRDKRSPQPKNDTVSRVMSANKAKNTQPEVYLRKILRGAGYKGYRLHSKKIDGKPDVAFTKSKIAIFLNGCFWHRCPHCNLPMPKNNTGFWTDKFNANRERDQRKQNILAQNNWKPYVIWECELNKQTSIDKLLGFLRSNHTTAAL